MVDHLAPVPRGHRAAPVLRRPRRARHALRALSLLRRAPPPRPHASTPARPLSAAVRRGARAHPSQTLARADAAQQGADGGVRCPAPTLSWTTQSARLLWGGTARGTYGTPGAGTLTAYVQQWPAQGKLQPRASGTHGTQEAGTRSPHSSRAGDVHVSIATRRLPMLLCSDRAGTEEIPERTLLGVTVM